MTAFKILTGATLGKAIAGHGKKVATYKAHEHQLAVSAINHANQHGDPKYVAALLEVTPRNHQAALVSWILAFSNLSFDKATKAFTVAKGKKAKVEESMKVAPADYGKDSAGGKKDFDEMLALAALIKKCESNGATAALIRELKAVETRFSVKVIKGDKADKPAKTDKPAKAAKPEVVAIAA